MDKIPKYVKVLKANNSSPYQNYIYKTGKIYKEENPCIDTSIECAPGIYFIEPHQLPLWWNKTQKLKIVKVKPLAEEEDG